MLALIASVTSTGCGSTGDTAEGTLDNFSANAALISVNLGTSVTLAGILSVSQSSNLEASASAHVMKFSLFAAMIGAAFSYPAQLIV